MSYVDMVKTDMSTVAYYLANQSEHTCTEGTRTLFVVGLRSTNEIFHFVDKTKATHVYIGAQASYYKKDGWELIIEELFDDGLHITFEYLPEAHHTMVNKIPEHIWTSRRFEAVINTKISNVDKYKEHITVKYSDNFLGENGGNYTMPVKEVLDHNRLTTWAEYGSLEILATKAELRLKRLNSKKRK